MKKIIISILLGCTTLLSAQSGLNYEFIEDKAGLLVATPDLAKRQIRKIRLENGLEALLISDPLTHESGAALSVAVGSWDDPKDRPGMAHFVEHMLFLGTEKYPEEEGYTRYLDGHGGKRNAFTMTDRTVYIFSVNNNGFSEALDRFGQFFVAPLFSPSGVDRESKAIHSEFCRNVPLDQWRMLYVKKELANTEHPFHAFCIGNKDSLKQISQDELKEWYKTHYSSNLMHLVVYSPESLDTLEKEVVNIFSAVENKNKIRSHYNVPLTSPEKNQQLCVISPVQEIQTLELTWEIPRFFGQDRQIQADRLLSYVLGHEGSTSLLAQLKRENLAEGLGVGNHRAGHDQCLLSLEVQLTSKGVKEYEKVIARCFEGIASIRKSGIPLYIYEEVCHLGETRYRFQSREEVFDLVSEYATSMVDEPLETFPRQTLFPTCYEPEKIQELINIMTPETCQYALVADPTVTKIAPTIKERFFGVEYTQVPISSEKITAWTQIAGHQAISIPRPNPYLPSQWALKGEEQESSSILPEPTLLCDDPLGKVYVATDTQFLVPEVKWTFHIKTPEISEASPLSHVLADLYCHTLSENLNALSYEALTAGLTFSLEPKKGALELKIKGYSDKAAEFLKTIVTAMKTTCPTREQFDLYYDLCARDYLNTLKVSPIKEGGDLLWSILYQNFASLDQKSAALKKTTYAQVKQFCNRVLKNCYVEGMLYGNLTATEGQEIWDQFKQTLSYTGYPKEKHLKAKLASLPAQNDAAYLVVKSEHPAHALILTADCGVFSFKRRAAQEILTKGLEEPFFSELRTRQQTAYVVANWSQEIERHLYNFFAIQSSSHDSRDLLSRFELFLENSLQHLKDEVIPEERFESIRAAYIEQLQHPVESLSKMGSLLHSIAFDYDADFEWVEKRIKAFQELTYAEFVDFAHEFLGKENTRRLAVSVQGNLPKLGGVTYQHITSPSQLRKQIIYKDKTDN
jgi:insulysin